MANAKHQAVRLLYRHRCGYCGISETDSGGELTVDHHQPIAAGGGDDESNLVYACIRCNQFKGRFWPSEEDLQQGKRVLHPFADDFTIHFHENLRTGELEPDSASGQFHIELLHLNRSALVEWRVRQRLDALMQIKLRLLERENLRMQEMILDQDNYVVLLANSLNLSSDTD